MQARAGSLTGEELGGILSQVGGNSFMCDRRNLGCVVVGGGAVGAVATKRFLSATRLPWLQLVALTGLLRQDRRHYLLGYAIGTYQSQ